MAIYVRVHPSDPNWSELTFNLEPKLHHQQCLHLGLTKQVIWTAQLNCNGLNNQANWLRICSGQTFAESPAKPWCNRIECSGGKLQMVGFTNCSPDPKRTNEGLITKRKGQTICLVMAMARRTLSHREHRVIINVTRSLYQRFYRSPKGNLK